MTDIRLHEKFISNSGEIEVTEDKIVIKMKKKRDLPEMLAIMKHYKILKYPGGKINKLSLADYHIHETTAKKLPGKYMFIVICVFLFVPLRAGLPYAKDSHVEISTIEQGISNYEVFLLFSSIFNIQKSINSYQNPA